MRVYVEAEVMHPSDDGEVLGNPILPSHHTEFTFTHFTHHPCSRIYPQCRGDVVVVGEPSCNHFYSSTRLGRVNAPDTASD